MAPLPLKNDLMTNRSVSLRLKMSVENVVWKWIKGYEGVYMISNRGCVKSFKRYPSGRLLKPRADSGGYLYVGLHKDKKQINKLIHRLVAEAFLWDWDKSKDVDHIDMNRLNNHVNNLRIASQSQNQRNVISLKGSTSKYKNVHWSRRASKWKVQIKVNGKQKHIGYFISGEEAGRAADSAAKTFLSEEDLVYYRFNFS